MRKSAHAANSVEDSIAYIVGRIEVQIETFALRMGIPAAELAHRVAAFLSPAPVGQVLGPDYRLPDLRPAAGDRDIPVEPVAVVGSAHRLQAPPATQRKAGNSGSSWAKMTSPRERSEEMLRRMLKSKSKHPTILKQIKAIRAKLRAQKAPATKKSAPPAKKHGARNPTKQQVYHQRHLAKKAGLPLPPLPKSSS